MSGEKHILQREQPLARETPLKRYLALREAQYLPTVKAEQMEFESITNEVDDREAKKRHLEAIQRRYFFGYYLKCKDPEKKLKLIDTYNKMALLGKNKSR